MNDLTIIKNEQGQLLVDSREVAGMIGKNHKELMRSIRGYVDILEPSAKLRSVDFFIESTYQDANNQSRPCYLLTRKGCDMVANKMTGEKGVLFTAAYVTKFEEMEQQLKPTCIEDVLISSLQEMKALKGEVQAIKKSNEETKGEIQGIRDVVAINSSDWKVDCKSLVVKIANNLGGFNHIQDVYKEVYSTLERRMGVQLSTRLTNKRRRMADEGVCKSKRDKLNYIDVIADDKKLIEGYVAITKELAIKYGVA